MGRFSRSAGGNCYNFSPKLYQLRDINGCIILLRPACMMKLVLQGLCVVDAAVIDEC